MKDAKLTAYRKKRDFALTSEPKGESHAQKQKRSIFVIQKHAATHLHYDFRLEIGNILKSWAIPKGPSLNPQEKRLAIETEDHPLEYKDFEGIIPEGQYGGGTVLIWDRGTYESYPNGLSLEKDYQKGNLDITLEGEKLKGRYVIRRIRNGEKPQWLLIKVKDEYADLQRDITKDNKSILSGKTLKEINPEAQHD